MWGHSPIWAMAIPLSCAWTVRSHLKAFPVNFLESLDEGSPDSSPAQRSNSYSVAISRGHVRHNFLVRLFIEQISHDFGPLLWTFLIKWNKFIQRNRIVNQLLVIADSPSLHIMKSGKISSTSVKLYGNRKYLVGDYLWITRVFGSARKSILVPPRQSLILIVLHNDGGLNSALVIWKYSSKIRLFGNNPILGEKFVVNFNFTLDQLETDPKTRANDRMNRSLWKQYATIDEN